MFYNSPQAVSDRESEAARRVYEDKVHRGTYPFVDVGTALDFRLVDLRKKVTLLGK